MKTTIIFLTFASLAKLTVGVTSGKCEKLICEKFTGYFWYTSGNSNSGPKGNNAQLSLMKTKLCIYVIVQTNSNDFFGPECILC